MLCVVGCGFSVLSSQFSVPIAIGMGSDWVCERHRFCFNFVIKVPKHIKLYQNVLKILLKVNAFICIFIRKKYGKSIWSGSACRDT